MPDNYHDEMEAFGWWFVSNKFDDKWAITQLIEALIVSGKAKQGRFQQDMVVEKLANLVQTLPNETVQCLDLIAKWDREGLGIYLWRNNARAILIEALRTEAAGPAKKLIHYLGSRGYIEFRELLRGTEARFYRDKDRGRP